MLENGFLSAKFESGITVRNGYEEPLRSAVMCAILEAISKLSKSLPYPGMTHPYIENVLRRDTLTLQVSLRGIPRISRSGYAGM